MDKPEAHLATPTSPQALRLSSGGENPSPWRVWLLAIRPATLWAAVVPVAVGTALAAADGAWRWGAAWAAALGAVGLQVGTNLYNDAADFRRGADTEARLGPPRAAQKGWLSERQILAGASVAFAFAVSCGIYLITVAGWPVAVIGTASVVAGVAYTGGPFPLGYRGLGELFVFAFFGLVAVCGTYYVQALTLRPGAVWASVSVGGLASAILVVNNLRDRRTDAAAGKRTLAVRFGSEFARRQYAFLVLLAYGVPVAAYAVGSGHRGWLLPLVSLPFAVACIAAVYARDGAALNPILGRTARIETVFGLLLAVGVLL